MIKLVFLLFGLFFAKQLYAHKYYFGFAELEYNELQNRFEGTLIFTQHDFEMVLAQQGKQFKPLESFQADSLTLAVIHTELARSFRLLIDQNYLNFKIIGLKSLKTGMLELYIISDVIEVKKSIEIEFSSLMDTFPEQMNKLNFIFRDSHQAVSFTPVNRKKIITITQN